MKIFLDESGDLGFTLTKPYRRGGSSRFLTITFLLIPNDLSHLTVRMVKKLYEKRKRSFRNELKGTDLSPNEKLYFANRIKKLLQRNKRIKIFSITVNKVRVAPHIRQDSNKLYNYMIGLVLPERIKGFQQVSLVTDERTIKVKSGNSLVDYLQIMLWFVEKTKTVLIHHPSDSSKVYNLQFVDWVSHIIWSRYEDNENEFFNIIKNKIDSVPLFFSP